MGKKDCRVHINNPSNWLLSSLMSSVPMNFMPSILRLFPWPRPGSYQHLGMYGLILLKSSILLSCNVLHSLYWFFNLLRSFPIFTAILTQLRLYDILANVFNSLASLVFHSNCLSEQQPEIKMTAGIPLSHTWATEHCWSKSKHSFIYIFITSTNSLPTTSRP